MTSGFIINVLRNWVREQRADPTQAFPGNGQQKPDDAAIPQRKREVARLMRGAALFARPRRRAKPVDCGARALHMIAPHVLDRECTAQAPNPKWVADVTHVWTDEGWLYAAVVLDRCARRVVGWAMQATMTAQLVTDALLRAVWCRGPTASVLHHSDQGSQYTGEHCQRLLSDLGVTCRMSRSGNVWDNAVMERCFSTMKIERCHRIHSHTRNVARADLVDYIARCYNLTRRHSSLGNQSLLDFARMKAVA